MMTQSFLPRVKQIPSVKKSANFSSESRLGNLCFTTEWQQGILPEYGENTFDQYATGMDGVAFVIDMDNREIAVVHFGEQALLYG